MNASASSKNPLTLVIVGGVAGGASAATRARRMDEHARIILYEKDEHASFANCGLPYYIGGEITDRSKLIVAKPELFRDRFNIELHTRHEVTAINRREKTVTVLDRNKGITFTQKYDKLILSPGASPVVPSLRGVESSNVFSLRNLADTDRIFAAVNARSDGHAVVIGAGFIGLEMVEMLHRRGMKVTLVELQKQVLPPLDPEMASRVEQELIRNGVKVHLGAGLAGFETSGGNVSKVILSDETKLDADLVILGIGVKPNVKLAQEAGLALGRTGGIVVNEYLQTSDPDIYAAGDAVEYRHGVSGLQQRIPLAGPANRAGRLAGQHAVCGQSRPMAPVLGTAIVRVFETTAALTGLTQKTADPAHSRAIWVTTNHHAGYYPGAKPLNLKLIYDTRDSRVLGAQAVGAQGVDKRMDVIATAIQLKATVYDLTELDLAYAPPFGSAKDPIHMAAFAACNDLDGLMTTVRPDVDFENMQVVDVRTAKEFAELSFPGTINIPVDELRQRIGELDPKKETIVTCASGVRSYVAARILEQHGFSTVLELTGGASVRSHTGQPVKRGKEEVPPPCRA